MRVPVMGSTSSPRADTAEPTIVTSELAGATKPPQLLSPGKRGSKSVMLAAQAVVPSGVWLLEPVCVAVWLAVCEDELVRVCEAVDDAEGVPVVLDEPVPVALDEPVPVELDEPVPVWLELLVPVVLDEPVPVALDEPVPVMLA